MLRLRELAITLGLLASCKGSDPPSTTPSPSATPTAVAPAPASGSAAPTKVEAGTVDTAATGSGAKPVIHGDKWNDPEEGGRNFAAFKETWVYVDGEPRGVMLIPELPAGMPHTWKDDVEGLDFHPGDPPPHEKKIQTLRWRLADYFRAIGIDLAKIRIVYLHGSGYVAIPGPVFRKYADGIQFDFTGNDLSKSRFYWPTDMPTNTTYDRYAAVSVFIKKPPLTLDKHNNPSIDGVEVGGIPYHGTPERGGFRVYVDYKLAMVIKRNELGTLGRSNPDDKDGDPRWSMRKLLEARSIHADVVAADLVIARDMTNQRRQRLDEAYVKDLEFTAPSQTSGGIQIGKDKLTGNAIQLYTRGHVPPDKPIPPFERDWQATN